ncbi:MAG: hypothetical protein BMS9Abin05_0841 [Rhodothermia bacterium]|nr:MAG: hypothetical protein BMS9Abin05_0841 [Rhodothermia bacterium]
MRIMKAACDPGNSTAKALLVRALALVGALAFVSDVSAQSFVLKTVDAGFDELSGLNGVSVADYDLDGDLDVYFVSYLEHDPNLSDTWNRLYRNNGDKTFTDVTEAAGLTARVVEGYDRRGMGNQFGSAWGDYDNDGDPDLLLTNVGTEILFQNNGDGTFSDATDIAGIGGPGGVDDIFESSSAVWWDFDDDGDLDLHVAAWIGFNRMYENNGDGTFLDVSDSSGLKDDARTWTAVPLDVNNDGLMDLYLVNDFSPNTMYVNNGDRTFSDETANRGLGNPGHGMGVTVEDYNGDGFFDIYVTNIFEEGIEWNPLYTNDGTGHFSDESKALEVDNADWAWGTEWFDSDNDGDLDLYVANGFILQPAFENRLFLNALSDTGVVSFSSISGDAGTNGTAQARGLAVFDYDDDGDLDLLVANHKASPLIDVDDPWPYLYENISPELNWIKIDLEGTTSNRNGFGATIRLTTDQGTSYRHNDGVGFLSQSVRPIHFGVGSAALIDEIQVSWPSGRVESYSNISINQTIHLLEGQGIPTHTDVPSVLPDSNGPVLLSAFPNPVRNRLTIEFESTGSRIVSIELFNLLGQIVRSTEVLSSNAGVHRTNFDLNGLSPGLYYYRLSDDDRRSLSPAHSLIKLR